MPLEASRRRAVSLLAVATSAAVLVAGCGSSGHHGSTPAPTTTTVVTSGSHTSATTDPNHAYNPIPYNVGDLTGLPNGWRILVAIITRPYANAALPAAPAGQQYVGVKMEMLYDGTKPIDVHCGKIFAIVDDMSRQHAVVAVPGHPNGLDGSYKTNSDRYGELVFMVPAGHQLRMLLDGPKIDTQLSVFSIDPPKAQPRD